MELSAVKTTRRRVLTGGLAASAGAVLTAPAVAQSLPKLAWRMPTSFGKNLVALHGSAELFANVVSEMTHGSFKIQLFGPGEIVPPLQIADAVTNGTVEMGQTASFYYAGKDPVFALGCGLVFGMNVRGHAAWLINGGGNQMMQEFYSTQNIHALFAGNTGAQAAGWFRKEIKSINDLQGMRMRIAGLAGQVFADAGGVPQQIAPGDVYAALERGTIDGTKFTSPIDDEKLGFFKVAPYYYWPGWNDGGVAVHIFVNLAKWNELPKTYQVIMRSAAALSSEFMQTKYDAENAAAVKRVVALGAQLRWLPEDVIDSFSRSTKKIYAGLSEKNSKFKSIYDHYVAFMRDQYTWWRISEMSFDGMMVRQLSKT